MKRTLKQSKMNISSQAIEKILLSTIENGGYTVNPITNESPKSGFMVSVANKELKVSMYKGTRLRDTIKQYITDNKESFERGFSLGLWIDNNRLYLDVSLNILDPFKAYFTGMQANQLAIYDLNKHETIKLKEAQTSGTYTQISEYAKLCASQFEENYQK